MLRGSTIYLTNGTAAIANEPIAWEDAKTYRERIRKEEIMRTNARRKSHAIAMRKSKISAFYVSICFIAIGLLLFSFVHLQSNMQTSLKNINSLENQITELRAKNDASLSRINTATNLTNIRSRATQELGMHYADSSQIRYYESNSVDYMVLYEQVQ